jgi:hypothetical protein
MNVGIGTGAAQFLSWEYSLRIFGIVSLQCSQLTSDNCAKRLSALPLRLNKTLEHFVTFLHIFAYYFAHLPALQHPS